MKKLSVLAVAVAAAAFAASAASAATVYDKDGTTLAVGGQIEVMAGNAGNNYFGNGSKDATTRDRARVTMSGRTQLTDGIAAYAYNEWQIDHEGTSDEAQNVKARQQYLGVDFGKFGKVQVGRYTDPFEYASNLVDVLDEVGVYGGFDERNSGHISYMWSGFGFDAGISYQMAVDNYRADEFGGKFNVDSGFSVYAGYTTPSVLIGPIAIRAGYLYLNGQAKDDAQQRTKLTVVDNSEINLTDSIGTIYGTMDDAKAVSFGLAWGTNGKGLYIASEYHYAKLNFSDVALGSESAAGVNDHSILGATTKAKAWESVVTYGFDNGVRIGASYHIVKHKYTVEGTAEDAGTVKGDTKWVELIADYNVTPNFKVWAEGVIDAGSDVGFGKIQNSNDGTYVICGDTSKGHNALMVGARYVF